MRAAWWRGDKPSGREIVSLFSAITRLADASLLGMALGNAIFRF
jgi:hypothetical protein